MSLLRPFRLTLLALAAATTIPPAALAQAPAAPAAVTAVDATAVARHYARLVQASYEDTLAAATVLQQAVTAFAAAPSADGLQAARQAWLAAREWYGQTEAFRFYAGPIDDDKGPEGRLNSWPLDESYIDYVKGKPGAGFINDRKIGRAHV